MPILALDLATTFGWCIVEGDQPPRCGTVTLPRVERGKNDLGPRAHAFARWLDDWRHVDAIAFETPVLPRMATTPATVRTLNGLVWRVEEFAYEHGVTCREVNVSTAKKVMTGNGRAQKNQMTAAAVRRGFPAASEHEADAAAVWLVAAGELDPDTARRFAR